MFFYLKKIIICKEKNLVVQDFRRYIVSLKVSDAFVFKAKSLAIRAY